MAGQFRPEEADAAAISAATRAFSAAYVRGDFAAMAAAYTETGHILPHGASVVSGRDAIRERWRLPPGVTVLEYRTETVELRILGDYAYDLGHYAGRTRRADGSEAEWAGQYAIVWRKLDGDWLMQVDMWEGRG
ncbi:YybH family protein [Lewinella sp. IMCC34183]|uniref:YybH family protein n=1 Tax=Lewinella sp. IMCC34183 TaxID=2248762 RepID=UPI0013005B66|nr:nuclear transport factor 2 family protein [Lewinella sp. IMCC34183]